MVERKTLARPYANAVFEIAKSQGDYGIWSNMLQRLSELVTQDTIATLLKDYTISPKKIAEVIITILGDRLTVEGQNLVSLLAGRRKLKLIPSLSSEYEKLRAKAENTIEAQCYTVLPLTEAEKNKFKTVLSTQLGKKIELNCHQDPTLLGGFIIRAGDRIIDGSLRGQLMNLKATMGG